MSYFKPVWLSQWATGTSSANNCGPAAIGVAVEKDWLGAKTPSVSDIRDWITTTYSQAVNTFTTMPQLIAAVADLYGTTLTRKIGFPFADIQTGLQAGAGCVVRIYTSPMAGTTWDSFPTTDIYHFLFLASRRYNAISRIYEILVYDSNARSPYNPAWWPESLVKDCMAIAGNEAGWTRNTEGAIKKIICTGTVLRASMSGTAVSHSLTRGQPITTDAYLGGATQTTLCPITITSAGWFRITAVNGTAMSSFWPGHSVAYVARGMLKPY